MFSEIEKDSEGIFRIHCHGHWLPSQVRVEFDNRDFELPGDLPDRAQQFWQKLLTKSPHFFNGALCRLEKYQAKADFLYLHLSRTCYRDLLFCNEHAPEILKDFGEEALVRALGISVIIETADGFLPLMQRSQALGEGAGLIDVFGGHVHPDDHARNGAPDVFHAIADELFTELNLASNDFDGIFCVGLLENWQTRKPELIFETKIKLTFDELREKARQAKEGDEYTGILSVRTNAEEVREVLRRDGKTFTPIGHGSLILLGKLRNWW